MKYIDLRSDTVTKPSQKMLEAMMRAEVGDDVYGEDPTVNNLQKEISVMFGKEASLFVPTGTMGNQICIKVQTCPGDEIIVEQNAHIFVYENAAPAFLSGVQMNPIKGRDGIITAEQIKNVIRPKAYYFPKTKLICLENTHGSAGGTIFPIEEMKNIFEIAQNEGIRVHLDGARLWNACVETGIKPSEYAKYTDSLSVCFSKGLGAPIGSIIIGSYEFIEKAKKYRKLFGGGMRQVGILAGAAIYAIKNNIERLKEDHDKARYIASELKTLKQLDINLAGVQTNIVIIGIEKTGKAQQQVLNALKDNHVLLTPEKQNLIRAVTHLNVDYDDIKEAVNVFKSLFR